MARAIEGPTGEHEGYRPAGGLIYDRLSSWGLGMGDLGGRHIAIKRSSPWLLLLEERPLPGQTEVDDGPRTDLNPKSSGVHDAQAKVPDLGNFASLIPHCLTYTQSIAHISGG